MCRGAYGLGTFAIAAVLGLALFSASAQAVKLKPFDTPPPEVDPAKLATLPPGTSELDYDRMLMVSAKGYVIMKVGPKNPIPPDIQPAAPGIEIRLIGTGTFPPTALKQVVFMTRQSGEQQQITAYLGIFTYQDRVVACGYYVRNDKLGFDNDFFFDPRSYLDVGGAFRLPTAFLKDQTSMVQRPDGKVGVRCVATNVEWDPAYSALPLSLHLEDKPLQFEWQTENSAALSPTRRTLPPPKIGPPPSPAPMQRNPYD